MVKNYQKYSKNYFFRSQQLSTIKDNSRSQITQIKQNFFRATLRGGGECYAVGETTIPRLESRDCFDYYAPRRMGLVDEHQVTGSCCASAGSGVHCDHRILHQIRSSKHYVLRLRSNISLHNIYHLVIYNLRFILSFDHCANYLTNCPWRL